MELIFGFIAFAILYWIVRDARSCPASRRPTPSAPRRSRAACRRPRRPRRQAQAALEQYKAQLPRPAPRPARIREEAREQGARSSPSCAAQAQAEAARITESAHKQIEAERQQAVVSLRGEVGRLSTDLASRIVGESLQDETRQSGIVERFLAELEAGEHHAREGAVGRRVGGRRGQRRRARSQDT